MNYYDLTEKLGVVKNDKDKEGAFCNKVYNAMLTYKDKSISSRIVFNICHELGTTLTSLNAKYGESRNAFDFFINLFYPENEVEERAPVEFKEFLTRLSVIFRHMNFSQDDFLFRCVRQSLEDCNLPYAICDDIIIPKGVKEFDEALVCDVAEWLKGYPNARKTYMDTLQDYYENDKPRDIADNLRKTFEDFLHEFFGNEKNMDNNIKEVDVYLKNNGINEETRKIFTTLIAHYNLLNNKTAKHYNATDKSSLEFLLYQTGIFMRYLLVIKQAEQDGD